MNDRFTFLKRYRLLITLVLILFALGVGCWLVKKKKPYQNNIRKDDVLRQLDQRNR